MLQLRASGYGCLGMVGTEARDRQGIEEARRGEEREEEAVCLYLQGLSLAGGDITAAWTPRELP